ncbi:MAG TPA: hypothetical protein VG347_13585, partial [Verrucomicrobiae bacterium]|nr:hypothetical protein [Verrucomicrobiae bacterium]
MKTFSSTDKKSRATEKEAAEGDIRLLRFGIPSLDRMFFQKGHTYDAGINLRPPDAQREKEDRQPLDQHVSLCIQGPSGTGKSVLGLHLLSRYWADSLQWESERKARNPNAESAAPRILYLSTDLGIKRARSTWNSFYLGTPN